jgi:glycosyltransferase 2 family protein
MTPDDTQTTTVPFVASTSRHPGDIVRLLAGALVLGVTVLAVYRDRLSIFETNLFRLVNDLPSAISPYLNLVMQAGNVGAAPAFALASLVIGRRRNWRASFDIVVAGTLAWFAAKVVKDAIQRPRPGGLLDDVARFGSTEGLGFVSGHTAVAAAIACAAAPYLPRGARRAAWVVVWLVGLSRIYFGAHLPLDIVGGAALGWMIGAGIHLLLGAPHGIPSPADVERVLRSAGWRPRQLERVPGEHTGSVPYVATLERGSVFVKLLDPDIRDRDLILRTARLLSVRDVRDEAAVLDPPDQANREAAMTLLARQHGTRVPNVLAITRHPHERDLVWLVLEHVPGRDLRRVDPAEATDELLHDLWVQLACLRSAGLAHRELIASNILVDRDGRSWIVDFAHAESSARPHALANDVAELLVTTSLLVGHVRAIDAAIGALGTAAVAEALPELASLALTPQTRRELRSDAPTPGGPNRRQLLGDLRDLLSDRTASARPLGPHTPVPHGWRAGLAVAVALGVSGALAAIAGPDEVVDEMAAVSPRWLGIAVVAWAVAALSATVGLVAAVERRLAVGRVAVVRAIAASTAFSAGRGAATEVTASHLARAGVPRAEAGRATMRTRSAAWAAWAAVTLAALVEAVDTDHTLIRPSHLGALVGVALAALVAHLLLASRRWASREAAGPPPADGDGVSAGLGVAGWIPIATAALLELIAAMVAGLALVTAISTPVPVSYAAVVVLAGWAVVRLAPIERAVALRPAVLAIGLAASGASPPAAIAVAIVATAVEVVALGAGYALGVRSASPD